jgi:hypothetical protein
MYVRSPGGILVECTANVPGGFFQDEAPDELGTTLLLPPWFEDQRAAIVSQLEPITVRKKTGRGRERRRRPMPAVARGRPRREASRRCRCPVTKATFSADKQTT